MSSSLAHPGMAFPQGEEEEEEDVGMMLGGLWTPQSATCKRRWEASTCQREKQGKKLLAVNLAFFWQRTGCSAGLTTWGLARFAHP